MPDDFTDVDEFVVDAQRFGFTEREARIAAAVAQEVAMTTGLDRGSALDAARMSLQRVTRSSYIDIMRHGPLGGTIGGFFEFCDPWFDVIVDQWWCVIAECDGDGTYHNGDHHEPVRLSMDSDGLLDLEDAFNRLLDAWRDAHQQ